jgi:hypothetical protein
MGEILPTVQRGSIYTLDNSIRKSLPDASIDKLPIGLKLLLHEGKSLAHPNFQLFKYSFLSADSFRILAIILLP